MESFRHHPDNIIYVNGVGIPLEDFKADYPDYSLPEGWTGREYVKGEFHRLYNFRDEKFLDKDWKEGDKYINDISKIEKKKKELQDQKDKEADDKIKAEILDEKAKEEQVNADIGARLELEKQERIKQMEAYKDELRGSGVELGEENTPDYLKSA